MTASSPVAGSRSALPLPRISDEAAQRVAAVLCDARPRFEIGAAGDRNRAPMRMASWYSAGLAELSSRERAALGVLRAHEAGASHVRFHHVVATAARRDAMRVAVKRAGLSLAALYADFGRQFGATRPIEEASHVCVALAERGFSAAEIVRLLDATGIEAAGVSHDAALDRVQRRIERARVRARPRR